MIKKFIDSVRYIKLKDIKDILMLIVIIIPALFYRLYFIFMNKKLWLICEGENDARDSGYILFKYIKTNDESINVYYAINKKCSSYEKVKQYGNIIQFGSIKHWFTYIAATKNISIHKSASPNEKIFYVLHYYNIINGHRIFLQHGVTMNNVSYLHYKKTHFELFVCGAKPEYEYILEKFGYPKEKVMYLGFPTFDTLWECETIGNQIVVMPTWRSFLGRKTNILSNESDFTKSNYFITYQSFLNNPELITFLEQHDVTLYFYVHAKMERFLHHFKSLTKNIKIVNSNEADIQKLICESALMITDYSSVSHPFAYMGKALIYYQFDLEEFRQKHLSEGYFSYSKMGFGPIVFNEVELVRKVENYYKKNFKAEDKYLKRSKDFFQLHDNKNCERVVNKIKELDNIEN